MWRINTGPGSLDGYIRRVSSAFDNNDGLKAASLLSCNDKHIMFDALRVEHPESVVRNQFQSPIDTLVAGHLKVLYSISQKSTIQAFEFQCLVAQSMNTLLRITSESNWVLPILFVVAVDLRRLAVKADLEMVHKRHTKPGELLEKASNILMDSFRLCSADSRGADSEESKKWGLLNVVNQLLKIYFKINKLKLCDALIKAIENLSFKDYFSLAQRITYKFYIGKKALFEGQYKQADEYLSFAFENCHKDSISNKQVMLTYLIPVKMLLGVMPKEELLEKYNLQQFSEVAASVKVGNLIRLNKALEDGEEFFIKYGIYLLLEKLKFITYRNLFKKVFLLLKVYQLPVVAFTHALKFMNVDDIDDEETQCILANLIYERKVKGYLSYTHNKLVVSRQDPFPPLSTVI